MVRYNKVMSLPIHILYISGFGNRYELLRLRILKRWHYRDVTVELVPMRWTGKESFEQKIARIDRAIDRAVGKRIVIIGESAGGSMAVHMYARRPDDFYKVMGLCGKASHPETVGERYFERSPAFRTSMERLNDSIAQLSNKQKREFVSIHPLYDPVVLIPQTLLSGCRQVRFLSFGHLFSIFLALTIFSPLVVRTAKRTRW